MNKKRAFITGVAGQDGSYLSELLLQNDYKVYGLVRYSTTEKDLKNISHLVNEIEIIEGDITDASQMRREIGRIKPHEVYNLAAQSHVGMSFKLPEMTTQVTGLAVLNLLEGIRSSDFNSKFYQASTSELFGNSTAGLQNEDCHLVPVSPYGCAKLYAHMITKTYRESYNMFNCCGILFNHESPRRGENFVTRKIAKAVAAIKHGKQKKLGLGNLDARRDWGHAKDYVNGMWMMLTHNEPGDYVLATGETHSIREFCQIAFELVDLDYNDFVYTDPMFYRPVDVNLLIGDATKAKNILGWKSNITFKNLVCSMVESELKDCYESLYPETK